MVHHDISWCTVRFPEVLHEHVTVHDENRPSKFIYYSNLICIAGENMICMRACLLGLMARQGPPEHLWEKSQWTSTTTRDNCALHAMVHHEIRGRNRKWSCFMRTLHHLRAVRKDWELPLSLEICTAVHHRAVSSTLHMRHLPHFIVDYRVPWRVSHFLFCCFSFPWLVVDCWHGVHNDAPITEKWRGSHGTTWGHTAVPDFSVFTIPSLLVENSGIILAFSMIEWISSIVSWYIIIAHTSSATHTHYEKNMIYLMLHWVKLFHGPSRFLIISHGASNGTRWDFSHGAPHEAPFRVNILHFHKTTGSQQQQFNLFGYYLPETTYFCLDGHTKKRQQLIIHVVIEK